MAQIESIQVNIETETSLAEEPTASTSGSADESLSDTSRRLRARVEPRVVLGAGSDVVNPAVNDPRKQVLQTEDVESFPSTCASSRTTAGTTGTWHERR
jgi:hypothetical protein